PAAGLRGGRRRPRLRGAGRGLHGRRPAPLRDGRRARPRQRRRGRRRRRSHGSEARAAPAPGVIDLRSDLCAVPTDAMWEAMRRAELGWPRFGEDASLTRLCERGAALLGKPAATWVPTCGMANLVALLTFCVPGDRVVLESSSHGLSSGGMAIAEVARLEPRPVAASDRRPEPGAVEEEIRASRAALLVLENTHTRGGGGG